MTIKKKINLIKNIIFIYLILNLKNAYLISLESIFLLLENKKIRGFLNVIAVCEGTKKKLNNSFKDQYAQLNEYQVPFLNIGKIDNLKQYPNKLFCGSVKNNKVCASAAGRYQFIKNTWKILQKRYSLDKYYTKHKSLFENYFFKLEDFYTTDIINLYKNPTDIVFYKFGPIWQDIYAIILLDQCGAISDILNSNYKDAIKKAAKVWSTLPKDNSGLSCYENNINHARGLQYTIQLCKRYIPNSKKE